MFFFGNPEDTAKMYWEEAGRLTGPAMPLAPLDELTEQELRNVLTYQRIAIRAAWDDGAADEVTELLIEQYDQTFAHLAMVSDEFRDAVEKGRHRVIGGFTRENLDKYRRLAGLGRVDRFMEQEFHGTLVDAFPSSMIKQLPITPINAPDLFTSEDGDSAN
jgi:hypothetical protein